MRLGTGRTYCSPECSHEAQRRQDRDRLLSKRGPRILIGASCPECGDCFVVERSGGPTRVYCSDACAKRNWRRRDKKTRSKRIRDGASRESIDLAKIAERDGWRCHICKRKVTRRTWSLDHLIPLSDGGPHTHANVALAHRLCNAKRGAHGAAQLRLAA
jgi:5-methylcytosine-specific restriction endonuclease McrA